MTDSAASALLKGEGLPLFQQITPELVSQDVPVLLQQLDTQFTTLEAALQEQLNGSEPLSWAAVMEPMQKLGEKLRWSWGVVSHLNGVCNSAELRQAHAGQQPDVVRLGNRLGQSKVLHQALCRLRDQPAEPLSATQQRILQAELLSMHQRGVGLDGDTQTAFNEASERLGPCPPASATTFSMPPSSGR